jgi:PelA/Pel-15E family pectate lyase
MKVITFLFATLCLLDAKVSWKSVLKQKSDWYGSAEARKLADKVMLYQRNNGGWPKNQDFSKKIDTDDLKELTKQRSNLKDTTIDNGATYTPLKFLTRVWQAQASPGLEASLHRGIAFLLTSQYNNGGWPQRPRSSGYGLHITYNDGAMIGVMSFLRDLEKDPITFLRKGRKVLDHYRA